MDWIDTGIRTVKQPPNMINKAPPPSTIVPIFVEEVLQYLVNNPQEDTLPMLLTGQAHPRIEIVLVRLSTFVPHFLAHLFLAEHWLPKAMLQLIVPVLVQQSLLLECKPLVDWLKISVVQDNIAFVPSMINDTVLLAVDNVLMDHRTMLHRSDLPGHWVPLPPTQAIATRSDVFTYLLLKSWGL